MYKSILIPVDIEHPESWARPFALARDFFVADGITVHALYVLPSIGSSLVGTFFPDGFESSALDQARESLAAIVEAEPCGALAPPEQHVLHGEVYPEIIKAAGALKVDLIAMLAHRPGKRDYLLGSVAARVARHADPSILLVRE